MRESIISSDGSETEAVREILTTALWLAATQYRKGVRRQPQRQWETTFKRQVAEFKDQHDQAKDLYVLLATFKQPLAAIIADRPDCSYFFCTIKVFTLSAAAIKCSVSCK